MISEWRKDSLIEREMSFEHLQKLYGPFVEERFDVRHVLAQLRDSLKRSGVDTILVLQKSGNHWHDNYDYHIKDKNKLKPFPLKALLKSEPSYIFWKKQNRYFIKKIDQFYCYETVQGPFLQHFHLYDFYYRNKTALVKDHQLDVYVDTLSYGVPAQQGQVPVYHLEKHLTKEQYMYYPVIYYTEIAVCQSTSLMYTAGADSIRFGFYDAELKALLPYQGDGHHIRYANDAHYYYYNQMLPHNLWIKFIESEILKIELTGSWKVKD